MSCWSRAFLHSKGPLRAEPEACLCPLGISNTVLQSLPGLPDWAAPGSSLNFCIYRLRTTRPHP